MAESRVRRENYIVINGWMLSDLKLKGNELLVYACIYGFSQAENQVFSGSLQYLADWTNSTKQGVIKNLKSLVEKGYIQKTDKIINGVKFCEYYATELNTVLNSVEQGIQQSLTGGIKQSLYNNSNTYKQEDKKENNIENNMSDSPTPDAKQVVQDPHLDSKKEAYSYIISHLNERAGTAYRASSVATQKHINARLAEGFTVEDFFTVIDKKCAEWKGTNMERYLRPETLFGSKFEGYLNAPVIVASGKTYGATGLEIKPTDTDDLAGIF